QALVSDSITDVPERLRLCQLEGTSRTGETPVAQNSVEGDGVGRQAPASRSGPLGPASRALAENPHSGANLHLYSLNATPEGTDSQGEVTVRLEKDGRIVNGNGADTDIVIASAKAYINALNLIQSGVLKGHPKVEGI